MDIGQKLASVLQAASLANIVPHKAFTPTLDDAAVSRSEDSVYRSLLRALLRDQKIPRARGARRPDLILTLAHHEEPEEPGGLLQRPCCTCCMRTHE